tara:strand:- start:2799 stop:3044 length:246 start_codon:yes stop_codon:yes gene_type:complete
MNLKNEIAALIIDELEIENMTPESFNSKINLVEELGVDSMEMATLAIKIQNKYSIKIKEEDYENLTTLEKISEFVESRYQN